MIERLEVGLGARLKQLEATSTTSVADEVPAAETIEEDSAPVGPSDEEESAYLREETKIPVISVPVETTQNESAGELPSLEGLVQRIPAETLKTMDELFRAKFVSVKRVSSKDLKVK